MTPKAAIEAAAGIAVAEISPLSGGCVGAVFRVALADGKILVAKTAPPGGALEIEGYMLGYLGTCGAIPVPAVIHAAPDLLLMDYIEHSGGIGDAAQEHAADLLAALHGIIAQAHGHERDTLIGPLPQPNPWTESWVEFFRDQRLLPMGRRALDGGRLPAQTFGRLERFCAMLERHIDEPARPSLIHGDIWGGNVLCCNGRVAGFIDPAIYHGHAEIELAFSTLFATFGDAFFGRYNEHRPIRPGFFETRRDIYNLYPLLVHTALFGGHYAGSVEGILKRFI